MSDYLGGVWQTAAEAKAAGVQSVAVRRATPAEPLAVRAASYALTYVEKGAQSYEWNLVGALDNNADTGENCAAYLKAHKRGAGATWGLCIEAHDHYPNEQSAGLWGLEIDLMGAPNRRTWGAGLQAVIGKAAGSDAAATAHLDSFIKMVAFPPDREKVKIDHMIRSDVRCEDGIVSMQGGDYIKFSDDPQVPVMGFDNATGWIGLWKRIDGKRVLLWGVHALTGDMAKMLPLP